MENLTQENIQDIMNKPLVFVDFWADYFSRSFKKNVGVTPTEYKELEGR